jgi:hypothetical protein
MRLRLGLVLVGLGLVANPGALSADDEDASYAKLKRLVPPGKDSRLCVARTYDAEHLQAHPKQRVTDMTLSIRYTPLSEEDATLIAKDDGGIEKQYFRYDFLLAAKTRDRKETLYASGDCSSAQGIGCGVDCDGGGIDIEPVEGGNGSILVRISDSGYIRMSFGCGGEEHEVDLKAGEDDKVFRLDKTSDAACDAIEAERIKLLQ